MTDEPNESEAQRRVAATIIKGGHWLSPYIAEAIGKAVREETATLREALAPFAAVGRAIAVCFEDRDIYRSTMTVGSVKQARVRDYRRAAEVTK